MSVVGITNLVDGSTWDGGTCRQYLQTLRHASEGLLHTAHRRDLGACARSCQLRQDMRFGASTFAARSLVIRRLLRISNGLSSNMNARLTEAAQSVLHIRSLSLLLEVSTSKGTYPSSMSIRIWPQERWHHCSGLIKATSPFTRS